MNKSATHPHKPLKHASKVSKVPIAEIRTDRDTQTRAELNQTTINEYAAEMKSGDQFPPIVVFRVGKELWLVDGFHRLEAAKLCGKTEIDAEIHEGTSLDAFGYCVSANSGQNALRRTNPDKRCAVQLAVRIFGQISARELARRCAVSHTFAANVLNQLSTVDSSGTRPKRVGKDGKERSMPNPASRSRKWPGLVTRPRPGLSPESEQGVATATGSERPVGRRHTQELAMTKTTLPIETIGGPATPDSSAISELGKRAISWIAEYLREVRSEEISSFLGEMGCLGDTCRLLRDRAPSSGEAGDFRPTLDDLVRYVRLFKEMTLRRSEEYTKKDSGESARGGVSKG